MTKFDTNPQITVIKNNAEGVEMWRYKADLLRRTSTSIKIKAIYNNRPTEMEDLILKPGDLFLEEFFADRWYNIFAVFDFNTTHFKGWYCNITRPAKISRDRISADDLALDLIVYPDRRWAVFDEDEFNQIPLAPKERRLALQALEELIARVTAPKDPFNEAPSPF